MRVFHCSIVVLLCISMQAMERTEKTRSVEFRHFIKFRIEERLSTSCPELPTFKKNIPEELLDKDNVRELGVIILEDEEPNKFVITSVSSAE